MSKNIESVLLKNGNYLEKGFIQYIFYSLVFYFDTFFRHGNKSMSSIISEVKINYEKKIYLFHDNMNYKRFIISNISYGDVSNTG